MGRGLAVGDDHDDLVGISVAVEELPGEHEGVLQVRALNAAGLEVG